VRFPVLLLLVAFVSAPAAHAKPSSVAQELARAKMLELFIWKTSDELKLPADTETKYGETIRKLNDRRRKNADRMEKAIDRLDELTRPPAPDIAPTPTPAAGAKAQSKELEAALGEYTKAVKEFQQLQDDEIVQLKKVLSSEKLARYLVAKQELTEKLKSYLSKPSDQNSASKEAKPLEAPKVIEEK
jgi:hypothetical protein